MKSVNLKKLSRGKIVRSANILCLFDYKATTGFATVSHNVVSELERHFGEMLSLTILAVNYFGEPIKETERRAVNSAALSDPKNDPFGRNIFLKMIQEGDFDGIFIINDLSVITPIVPLLEGLVSEKRLANKRFKSIFYFPVDAPNLQHEFSRLDFFDVLVPYTEFARKQVLESQPKLKDKMRVILHGINHQDFNQLSSDDRAEFRKAYFGEENVNRYIIGNINRNQPRKDIPGTIFAFNEYRATYDENALLYLHMHPKDEMGWNLRFLCNQLGLVENKHYIFPPPDLIEKHPDAGYVNCIYNALDVYVTTTTGEGFGLTILEAMRCGLPVIAPYHSSIMELSGITQGEPRLFELTELFPMAQHYDSVVRMQCTPEEVAEKIDFVRNNQDEREWRVARAKDFAASLSWRNVCVEWIDVFKKTFY